MSRTNALPACVSGVWSSLSLQACCHAAATAAPSTPSCFGLSSASICLSRKNICFCSSCGAPLREGCKSPPFCRALHETRALEESAFDDFRARLLDSSVLSFSASATLPATQVWALESKGYLCVSPHNEHRIFSTAKDMYFAARGTGGDGEFIIQRSECMY